MFNNWDISDVLVGADARAWAQDERVTMSLDRIIALTAEMDKEIKELKEACEAVVADLRKTNEPH